MIQVELDALAGQINLKLLGSIVSFVTQTAKAGSAQKTEMRRRCIFSAFPGDSKAMQQEYGFLYLGELLERYEERFGMTPQDLRAIALALGYTREIAADGMFVGSQRTNFIQSVRRGAQGDIYLTGALYLLYEGQSDGLTYETQLKEWQYGNTEELIFAMSLFQDTEQALTCFKPQLSRLLGKDRTMPVFGNTHILQWVMAALFPLKKMLKTKDMAVIRALLALPVSYVKAESRPYENLREWGYTPLEIAYANVMAVESQCVFGQVNRNSITAEKMVIALFRAVLDHEKVLPAGIYDQLTRLYSTHFRFDIKCCGVHNLRDALKGCGQIQNPYTMAWFIGRESIHHPAVGSFDIMDAKWDPLATCLDSKTYRDLFEFSLYESMDARELRSRIDRYNELTQGDYLSCYYTHEPVRRFSQLVKAGLIDLWAAFQNSLAPDGVVAVSAMLSHIQEFVRGIQNVQAFRFFAQFLPQYGFDGFKQYLDPYKRGFDSDLWVKTSYGACEITLTLQRDFLADSPEDRLLLLHWVEEYFFTQAPEQYLLFARAVLLDKSIAALLSPEERRGLFELVICDANIPQYTVSKLKQLYQTPEEQQAEQAVKDAKKAEEKRQKHMELVQEITEYYTHNRNGSFHFARKFLYKYDYTQEQTEIALSVVYKDLEPLLKSKGYILAQNETEDFLRVCGNLLCNGTMDWPEFQSCILKIKEVLPNDSDCDPAA